MNRLRLAVIVAFIATASGAAVVMGLPILKQRQAAKIETASLATAANRPAGITVSVVQAAPAAFVETVLVTGTVVPRNEVLVGPEIDGLRVLEVLVEEGDRVVKGQVLARLVTDSMESSMAQNDATMAKATAAIAQAKSNIVQSEARLVEARNQFERAKPLKNSGYLSGSTYDQRESAARMAEAQLVSSRDGLKVAEAEYAQAAAQRREIVWRKGNTEVKSPANGIISRKNARVGGFAAGASEAIFRIIADGDIELEGDVPENILARLAPGQTANIAVQGHGDVPGTIRLVSPELDKTTRLGRVRIAMKSDAGLRIGAFGRGTIDIAHSTGLALPVSAVLYSSNGAFVQVVREDKVAAVKVVPGITSNGRVEIKSGLVAGDMVVARAGTFLRDGDSVRPLVETPKVSETKAPETK